MKRYTILDANGFVEHTELFEIGSQPVNAIAKLPKNKFIKPKYNKTSKTFVEGATQIELNAHYSTLFNEMYAMIFGKLMLYIRAIAMGKSIDDDLDYYQLAYTNKFNEATILKGKINNGDIIATDNKLLLESQLEGYATLLDYVDFIITAYSQGIGFRNMAIDMTEVMRKRVLKDKEDGNLYLGYRRMKLVNDLPPTVTAQEVGGIFNQIMTLV